MSILIVFLGWSFLASVALAQDVKVEETSTAWMLSTEEENIKLKVFKETDISLETEEISVFHLGFLAFRGFAKELTEASDYADQRVKGIIWKESKVTRKSPSEVTLLRKGGLSFCDYDIAVDEEIRMTEKTGATEIEINHRIISEKGTVPVEAEVYAHFAPFPVPPIFCLDLAGKKSAMTEMEMSGRVDLRGLDFSAKSEVGRSILTFQGKGFQSCSLWDATHSGEQPPYYGAGFVITGKQALPQEVVNTLIVRIVKSADN